MRKLVALIAVAAMMLSWSVVPGSAQTTDVIYTTDAIVHRGPIAQGETIVLSLCVKANQSLRSIQVHVYVDPDDFEVMEGTASPFLNEQFLFPTVNTAPIDPQTGDTIAGKVIIGGVSMKAVAVSQQETIASITLRARRTIKTDSPIRLCEMQAAGADAQKLTCKAIDGTVQILYGDVDGDGQLTATDVVRLFHSLGGLLVLTEDDVTMGDVNGDGSVTLSDVVRLFYKVNGQL